MSVPVGMLKAATDQFHGSTKWMNPEMNWMPVVEGVVEAALLWQKENPIVPTDAQLTHLVRYTGNYGCVVSMKAVAIVIPEWQRRMYDAPEPEVPEEIKDLLTTIRANEGDHTTVLTRWANEAVCTAFRRGKESV